MQELQKLMPFEPSNSLDSEDDIAGTLRYLNAAKRVSIDPLSTQPEPEDIFSLLYTSGTTGR